MFGLGVYKQEQYMRMGKERRFMGARVAYNLLQVGDHPGPEEIRVFEDISNTLRTSNGTFRTTFRNRFEDVDKAAIGLMRQSFAVDMAVRIEDRAVSHGLTSYEWARRLLPVFPAATLEASDLMLQLIELSVEGGETFIAEVDGTPLQYIKPPFVLSIYHAESWRNPLRRLLAPRARKRFERLALPEGWPEKEANGYRIRPIPYVHPEAAAFARSDSRLQFRRRSVFERSSLPCHVVRTMNIFNRSYFSTERLQEGFQAIWGSLETGGIWIAGRTREEDRTNQATFVPTNHATFLQKQESGWKVLDRIAGGWELEDMLPDLSR